MDHYLDVRLLLHIGGRAKYVWYILVHLDVLHTQLSNFDDKRQVQPSWPRNGLT